MTDSLTLAYLAGVIDSDGYITINRSIHKGRYYFGAVIGVSGTRREPHDLAASVWGGKVGRYVPKNPAHRPQFQWSRMGSPAAVAISEVLPFLRVKERQAWLALECQEHVHNGRGPDPYPEFLPEYDPTSSLMAMREEMVTVLNQDKRHRYTP